MGPLYDHTHTIRLITPQMQQLPHPTSAPWSAATGGQLQAVRMGYGFICLCQTGGAACHSRWCMSDCRVRQASGAPHPGGKDDAFDTRSLISCRRIAAIKAEGRVGTLQQTRRSFVSRTSPSARAGSATTNTTHPFRERLTCLRRAVPSSRCPTRWHRRT